MEFKQGARHLKGTYKGDLFTYSLDFSGPCGPIRAHMGPYGFIWALMVPYGPGPGPWRAGKVQKKRTVFFKYRIFLKNQHFWPPDNVLLWKNRVLQVSGRNTLENAYKIISKSKFSIQNVHRFGTTLQVIYSIGPSYFWPGGDASRFLHDYVPSILKVLCRGAAGTHVASYARLGLH